jgi:uncharacterized protein
MEARDARSSRPPTAGVVPPAEPPTRVWPPVRVQRWENISFLHWPGEPAAVTALLPTELSVLTWEGAAWVGVTPFHIRVRPPNLPAAPRLGSFPETNLRTYVTTPDAGEGVYFLRMEVAALWFVVTLRAFGLPYVWQRMRVRQRGDRFAYLSRPRPGSGGGGHRIVVRPGERIEPPGGGEQDRFLTARWGAYHRRGPVLLHTPVEHSAWPLQAAAVETCEVGDLFTSAGLPEPQGTPIARFSPGVRVRVGRPQVIG